MKTRLLIILLVTSTLGLFPPAYGLSCDIRTVQYQYDKNDLVFEGKVISKGYFPASETAILTFEIKNLFKGNVTDPITLHSNEGFYGFKFREEKTYIVFAEKTELRHIVPLCVPVYHSFPSIVQGLDSLKEGKGTFGSLDASHLYENLTEEEKKKLEKIQAEEEEIKQIEIKKTEIFRNVVFSVIIVGVFGGIPSAIFLLMRRRKRKTSFLGLK